MLIRQARCSTLTFLPRRRRVGCITREIVRVVEFVILLFLLSVFILIFILFLQGCSDLKPLVLNLHSSRLILGMFYLFYNLKNSKIQKILKKSKKHKNMFISYVFVFCFVRRYMRASLSYYRYYYAHGSSGWCFGFGSPEIAAANEMLYGRSFNT